MAYDEDVADRIRVALQDTDGVRETRMFGGLAFLVHGHMAVAASGGGGLMVRVPPEQTESLLAEDGAAPMEMRGRELSGWLRVGTAAVEEDAALQRWVDLGVAHVATLPPK
jgi:hypothetical protein